MYYNRHVALKASTSDTGRRRPQSAPESTGDGESLTDDVLDSVRMLGRLAMTVSVICEEGGLTLRQYRTLLKLVDRPLRANILARLTGTTRATLSSAIRNLEGTGS